MWANFAHKRFKMKNILIILIMTLILNAQERIVALSPSINEIVFALGAGEQIVANTDYALYPEASKKLPKVGGYFSPSLEKIVALKPTLVIMQNNNQRLSLKLERLGIKSKVITIDKLQSINTTILEIGTLLNKTIKAKEIVNNINKERKKLADIVQGKKILIVFGRNKDLSKQIFVAGQNLYYDEIINESNNSNALQSERKGQPILNMENIIACNPDIVLLLARCKADGINNSELIKPWLELPITAAKTKSIYINSNIYAGIPSDRLVLFLRDFRAMLEEYHAKTK
jgi:iron complex transport system substrate-binding protein